MRVSISPRGSFIAMIVASSPARLDQAWNQALIAKFAQRDARHLHLAIIAARPSGHLATIAHANDRAVARQRRKTDARLEALLHRTRLIVGEVQQALAAGGELLHQPLLAQIIFNRTLLCHSSAPFSASERWAPCRKGKLNAFSKSCASASVFAVVQNTMSRPSWASALSYSISGKMMCSLTPSA